MVKGGGSIFPSQCVRIILIVAGPGQVRLLYVILVALMCSFFFLSFFLKSSEGLQLMCAQSDLLQFNTADP